MGLERKQLARTAVIDAPAPLPKMSCNGCAIHQRAAILESRLRTVAWYEGLPEDQQRRVADPRLALPPESRAEGCGQSACISERISHRLQAHRRVGDC